MSRAIIILVFLLIMVGGGLYIFAQSSINEIKENTKLSIDQLTNQIKEQTTMKISSSVFQQNELIPAKYTCDGANISPPLNIDDVPQGTQSLVLIMEDPDVPKNLRADGLWIHWLVWDMPAEVREIPEGAQASGVIGLNTSGTADYTGPCPPDREHRYFFKLYALDTILDLDSSTDRATLEKTMKGHILEQSELIGRYSRE